MADKKSPLGKGLSALISEESLKGVEEESFIPNLPIEKIHPNPDQPRLNVKPESLVELADSIREHGIIEPLIVSKREGKYILVAGERRWRGAQLAQLKFVPVVIKETTPQQMLELAIVENVQRKDLNALEEALAFQQLNEEYNLTIPDISKKVGLSRPAVSNKIRLLQLPQQAKEALVHEKITEGHARALLGLENPQAITAALRIVMRDKLSVRATEDFVRKLNFEGKKYERQSPQKTAWSPEAMKIKDSLSTRFSTNITLTKTRRGGKIVIPFKDDSELEDIYSKMMPE